MAKQTRLTAEQTDKLYAEYVRLKEKRMDVDGPMSKIQWKSTMELFMSEEQNVGANWSNTELRRANRILARSGETLSRKQIRAFIANLTEENRIAFAAQFGIAPNQVEKFAKEHEGSGRAFLVAAGVADWNQYFNS